MEQHEINTCYNTTRFDKLYSSYRSCMCILSFCGFDTCWYVVNNRTHIAVDSIIIITVNVDGEVAINSKTIVSVRFYCKRRVFVVCHNIFYAYRDQRRTHRQDGIRGYKLYLYEKYDHSVFGIYLLILVWRCL